MNETICRPLASAGEAGPAGTTGDPLPTVATVSVAVQGTTVATVEGDITLGWASELISYFDVCSVAQAEQVSIHPDIQIWDCLLQSLLGLLPVQRGKAPLSW